MLLACNCNTNIDIRGRCCPVFYNYQFLKCAARIDTALFHLENDFDTYKQLEYAIENEKNIYSIFKTYLSKFNMNKQDIMSVIQLFTINYEQNQDSIDEDEDEDEDED